jgi:2-(3-amino-3-carboxypropyl)histidine synthase
MSGIDDLEYDLELDKVCKIINEKQAKNIILQFPEGLKGIATKVKDHLENNTKSNIIISGDLCFGACDLPSFDLLMGADLLIQFGHAEMPNLKCDIPILYVPAYSKLDVMPVVSNAAKHLKKNVGLITTIQHVHKLSEVKEYLQKNGFDVKIGEATGRITHPGQVLGCNLSCATSIASLVDCYLFIGSGNFHAIGIALSTKKPVIIADPVQNEVRETQEIKDRLLRQRHGAITSASSASSFGIIVSSKPGQIRMNTALNLKILAEKHKKKAYIIVLNEIIPEKLKGFNLAAIVSCACPRIAIDDFLTYPVPILTPQEFKIVLNEQKWEDYNFDTLP